MIDENEMVPARLATYGLTNDLPADDKRHHQFREERLKYGFDQTEIWDIPSALARFLLPRLKRFQEQQSKRCSSGPDCQGCADLKQIIVAFELIEKDEPGIRFGKVESATENAKLVEKGLDLFRQQLFSFWC